MNGSLKLTLAVALALSSTNALALGLGMIQVKSGLNEPLVAEIPVTGGPDETAGVSVALAAAADFERVGLSRSRIAVPLEFTVATGAKGNAVIKVTTKEAVRDPFLDFLIEVNWSKGKLLREYTVLLDPPTMAPAIKGSRASTVPVKDATSPTASAPLPAAASKPAKPPRSSAASTASTPSTPSAPAAPRSSAAGEYGPVAQGETLWEVAASTRPDDSVSLNQVMVSLLRANPNAFYKDNINSLKRGAILRVPSADEIRAAGSAAAAAAEVRSQNDAARGGGAAPTLVADTGSKPASSSSSASAAAPSKPASDRLELVPPKTAKNSTASAEKPGSGGSGDATVRAELARTKEALTSREQEAGELKSRVRELEDLKSKNDKLLSLKDSELAALQQKLKELQDKAAKPGTSTPIAATPTPPASTAATSTPAASTPATATSSTAAAKPGELTKEEIWGAAAGSKTAPTASATAPASSATPPAATPGSSTTSPATSGTTLPATTAPASSTTPAASTSTTPAAATSTPPATTSPSPGETIVATPPGSTTPTTPAPASTAPAVPTTTPAPPATPPAKPATSTTAAAKPSTPAKVQPLETAQPWYSNPTYWMYGLGGLAVLGGLGFLLSRLGKKKAPAAAAGGAAFTDATSPLQDEEDALLDRLAQYPDDTSAHLELTSLYYSQGDADKFEAAAQAMYAHIYDTNMPEWQNVQAMGRELVPSNPLFADAVATSAPAFGSQLSPEPMRFDGFDDSFGAPPPAATPPHEDDAFDFDLAAPGSKATVPPPSAVHDDFSFDLTPPAPAPSNYQTQVQPLPPMPDLSPPSRLDDDLIAADDAIGTKLDLAKAYLDMGDPDGARSMLEEVLLEGSEGQKGEARKLLAEIR